jgi:hypothetical protein
MHRTEGANNVDGLYTEGPPATTITADAMNTIQEEIANVIEGANIQLNSADGDTRDQLLEAINSLTSDYTLVTFSGVDYTVLDGDGYTHFLFTCGAADRDLNLPTAADNANRRIVAIKVDSGAGSLIVDGEGAELINEVQTIELPKQYDFVVLFCDGTKWIITSENISCQLRLDTYAGYGAVDNHIMQFTNSREDYGNVFSHNHGAYGNSGLEITINKSGRYAFSYSSTSAAGNEYVGLSLDSTQLNANISAINVQDRLAIDFTATGGTPASVAWSGFLPAGIVIRAHTNGAVPAVPAIVHFTATYIGS